MLHLQHRPKKILGIAPISIFTYVKKEPYAGSHYNLILQKRHIFMSLFLSALGLVMIFEGVPYFCAPSQVKIFAQKIEEVPDQVLRIIGFALMLAGLTIVYLGRSFFGNN